MDMDFTSIEDLNAPYLDVLSQTSLQEDKATKHGTTFTVHLVVKNSPFVITLGLCNSKLRTFNHLGMARVLLIVALFL